MSASHPIPLVVHEPRTYWARQLRGRTASWPVRLHETRDLDDLLTAIRHEPIGVLLIDSGEDPDVALDHLAAAAAYLDFWLVLFVDSTPHADRATLARAVGATHVVVRPVPPPEVATLLSRWVQLALNRRARAGWIGDTDPDPDAWITELVPALRESAS